MSSIRIQFSHKGLMIGIFLVGVLLSTLAPGESATPGDEQLLVGHQIENQSDEYDFQTDRSTEVIDSAQYADTPAVTTE
jgi:hypothetical protein